MQVETQAEKTVIGRAGGLARNARLSPEERSESARKAVLARWATKTPEERRQFALDRQAKIRAKKAAAATV